LPKVPDHTDQVPLRRMSVARGNLRLKATTCKALTSEGAELLVTARVAGILAAKDAGRSVPTALPSLVTDAFCDLTVEAEQVVCTMTVQAHARTTLEAHALAGCSSALLALWDAVKTLEQGEDGNFPVAALVDLRVVQNVVA
jgi:cyclic pyranopterin monophosphate synthase